MPTFGIVIDAVLLVFGLVWCKFMFDRLPSDLAELRSAGADGTDRLVIGVFWLITLAVITWIVGFLIRLFF